MRRVSKKQSALYRQHGPERKAFLEEFPRCWFCGCASECVHEIANGNGIRHLAFARRECWAATCVGCNCEEMTNKAKWPIERQLAVKALRDPCYFDLLVICEVRGRAPSAITLADVVPFLTLRTEAK